MERLVGRAQARICGAAWIHRRVPARRSDRIRRRGLEESEGSIVLVEDMMKLFGKPDGTWLIDGVPSEEHKRIEEVMQLRRIVAALVLKAGGQAKVDSRELIAMDPHTELSVLLDADGSIQLSVR